jgi:outer membrane cobalamin receptor
VQAAACAIAWAASGAAAAQTPTDAPRQTVVITASNRAQPIADVQAAVQVISQQELQRYAGTSLTEALMLAAGVDARPNGANSTLAIRGIITNAGSPVLLLVDGLRRTAKYGGTNLNLIAIEDVERIEVVRGPMSALYGADATGGVVNIITRQDLPNRVRPQPAGPGGLPFVALDPALNAAAAPRAMATALLIAAPASGPGKTTVAASLASLDPPEHASTESRDERVPSAYLSDRTLQQAH